MSAVAAELLLLLLLLGHTSSLTVNLLEGRKLLALKRICRELPLVSTPELSSRFTEILPLPPLPPLPALPALPPLPPAELLGAGVSLKTGESTERLGMAELVALRKTLPMRAAAGTGTRVLELEQRLKLLMMRETTRG